MGIRSRYRPACQSTDWEQVAGVVRLLNRIQDPVLAGLPTGNQEQVLAKLPTRNQKQVTAGMPMGNMKQKSARLPIGNQEQRSAENSKQKGRNIV